MLFTVCCVQFPLSFWFCIPWLSPSVSWQPYTNPLQWPRLQQDNGPDQGFECPDRGGSWLIPWDSAATRCRRRTWVSCKVRIWQYPESSTTGEIFQGLASRSSSRGLQEFFLSVLLRLSGERLPNSMLQVVPKSLEWYPIQMFFSQWLVCQAWQSHQWEPRGSS